MLTLKNISFGPVLNASGAQGFFGEGYPFHKIWRHLGLSFKNVTFVAKTTTYDPRPGNMPMRLDGITPKQLFPKCIKAKPFKGIMLNAVGLSGPGAEVLFQRGLWQLRDKPHFLSFMGVGKTHEEHFEQLEKFVRLFLYWLEKFKAPVGLEINVSCPNVGLDTAKLADEVRVLLDIAKALGIPLVLKFNALLPPGVAAEITAHEACDGICVSNTIPWGEQVSWTNKLDPIDWEGLFGTTTSPLEAIGGGGLSGRPLFPIVLEWVTQARATGLRKPINAGGGILSAENVRDLVRAGADAVSLGSIGILRPWQMQDAIAAAWEPYSWFDETE